MNTKKDYRKGNKTHLRLNAHRKRRRSFPVPKQPSNEMELSSTFCHNLPASSCLNKQTENDLQLPSTSFQRPPISSYLNIEESENDLGLPSSSLQSQLDAEKGVFTPNCAENYPVLEGRYIVDINFFFNSIVEISRHSTKFGCTLNNLTFEKETTNGLISTFFMRCSMCNETFLLHTSRSSLNKDAVLAMMSIGSGFTHLEHVTSALEIKCMSKRMYDRVHDEVCTAWEEESLVAMTEAAEEEKNLAIQDGHVNDDGVPLITVVADGTWAKRSYHSNYSSLSGAAAIIGFRTKKVLFLGVRNKYCTICKIAEKADDIHPIMSHKCYKNWSGSSSSMEADIIAEGFAKSLSMYGLIYEKLIADGDSNVYKKILDINPYKNVVVQKIECKNHLLRNYSKKLRELTKNTSSGPLTLRKKIQQNQLRLRWAICKAVSYRKSEDVPFALKVSNLQKDIKNSTSHVFGEHKECQLLGYFCDKPYVPDGSIMADLKLTDLYNKLQSYTNILSKHAGSLIYDVDNNIVEQFNSIIAKYIGGKRINYCKKRSYQSRCAAAVVSHNKKRPVYIMQKRISRGLSPRKYSRKLESKNIEKNKKRRMTPKRLKFNNKENDKEDNKFYGEFCEKPDMEQEELESAKLDFLTSLKKTEKEYNEIERCTNTQDSATWYLERRKRLTASRFGDVCKRRSYTSCKVLVESIIYAKDFFSRACEYGKLHENLAKETVQNLIGKKVESCGLFIDRTHPFLGASPDGLIGSKGLLEVKCPWSAREMTPEEAIEKKLITLWIKNEINKNHKWFYQIQGQLHITQREYCVIAVWTPHGTKIDTIFKDDTFWDDNMESKLISFYMDCLLPELVDPRKVRNMPIRDPDSILKSMENRQKTNPSSL